MCCKEDVLDSGDLSFFISCYFLRAVLHLSIQARNIAGHNLGVLTFSSVFDEDNVSTGKGWFSLISFRQRVVLGLLQIMKYEFLPLAWFLCWYVSLLASRCCWP